MLLDACIHLPHVNTSYADIFISNTKRNFMKYFFFKPIIKCFINTFKFKVNANNKDFRIRNCKVGKPLRGAMTRNLKIFQSNVTIFWPIGATVRADDFELIATWQSKWRKLSSFADYCKFSTIWQSKHAKSSSFPFYCLVVLWWFVHARKLLLLLDYYIDNL